MKLIKTWKLWSWPPSTNHMTGHGNGRAWDTTGYRTFKNNVEIELRAAGIPELSDGDYPAYKLNLEFYSRRWFKKNGQLKKRRDADNLYKPTSDAIFRAIGIDDAFQTDGAPRKRWPEHANDEFIMAYLWAFSPEDYNEIILEKVI